MKIHTGGGVFSPIAESCATDLLRESLNWVDLDETNFTGRDFDRILNGYFFNHRRSELVQDEGDTDRNIAIGAFTNSVSVLY